MANRPTSDNTAHSNIPWIYHGFMHGCPHCRIVTFFFNYISVRCPPLRGKFGFDIFGLVLTNITTVMKKTGHHIQ